MDFVVHVLTKNAESERPDSHHALTTNTPSFDTQEWRNPILWRYALVISWSGDIFGLLEF